MYYEDDTIQHAGVVIGFGELQGIVLFCSREERQATATESSVHRITVQLLLHV